jgi:MFS family permease
MPRWLNRTVVGVGLASLLADVGYEMATAILPGFVLAISLAAAPAVVGIMDGVADLLANLAKLGSGWLGDRLGRRKPFVVAGYGITGSAYGLWALAAGWPLLVLGKVLAWFGKGVRGPLRNAILADAIEPQDRGKAFGLHRAADTVGAVIGPLCGAAALRLLQPLYPDSPDVPFRWVFLLTLIPGLSAAVAFLFLVRERPRTSEARPNSFRAAIAELPPGFRRYLVGVGVFGIGDFSRSLLILAAAVLLTPTYGAVRAAEIAALLYAWHNACQALAAFPVGWLGDAIGRRGILVVGYFLGAAVSASLAVAIAWDVASWPVLAAIFLASGIYIAVEESLEAALTADLVPNPSIRGTAYGVLGVVNGVGDFAASALVGGLWLISPDLGFVVSAALMLLGAVVLWRWR